MLKITRAPDQLRQKGYNVTKLLFTPFFFIQIFRNEGSISEPNQAQIHVHTPICLSKLNHH